MRITSLSGEGVLSFDQFALDLSERVTFVVGPNGAGKSNLTRLLAICLRAVESADRAAGDVDRLLAAFPRGASCRPCATCTRLAGVPRPVRSSPA